MFRRAVHTSLALFACLVLQAPSSAQFYEQTNLVSDISGLAAHTDVNLKNPWGVSFSGGSPFWVSDQVTGVATLYNSTGTPQALVVTIPGGNPTGQFFNSTPDFKLTNNLKALFVFSTLNGTIAGWNGGTTAEIAANTPNAVYTGLALGNNGSGNFLYAADNKGGKIDAFNASFGPAALSGNFTDPNLPAGFTPYNIRNLNGKLYVTYMNDATGGGIIDTYNFDGVMTARITGNVGGGPLDAPWGMTIAPGTFGTFAGKLLVGNEDEGAINAFDPNSGAFAGELTDFVKHPIVNTGLWGLNFGNGGNGGDPNKLYFAAGINGENDGLFGSLSFNASQQAPEPGTAALLFSGLVGVGILGIKRLRR